MSVAGGRPGMAAVGDGAGGDVPDAEPGIVVMDAARRRPVEQLDRGVGGARREHPVVAGLEAPGAGRVEADGDAVFEQQRHGRGRHRDHAGRAGDVEILHLDRRAAGVGAEDLVRSGPSAAPADCALSGQRAVRGSAAGSIAAGSAGVNVMRRVASSTVICRISPGTCENSRTVVDDLDPVAGLERSTSSRPRLSSSSSLPEIMLATRLPTLAFSRDHLKVAPAPGWPGIVDLDPVELVLQPAIAAGRRQLAGIVDRRDLEGAGGQHAGRRRDQVGPAGHVVVRRGAGGVGAGILAQHAHLPDGLDARGRIDADGALDQVGLLEIA